MNCDPPKILCRLRLGHIQLKETSIVAFEHHWAESDVHEKFRVRLFHLTDQLLICDDGYAQVVSICGPLCSVSEKFNFLLILALIVVEGDDASIEPDCFSELIHNFFVIERLPFGQEAPRVIIFPDVSFARVQKVQDLLLWVKSVRRRHNSLHVMYELINIGEHTIVFKNTPVNANSDLSAHCKPYTSWCQFFN